MNSGILSPEAQRVFEKAAAAFAGSSAEELRRRMDERPLAADGRAPAPVAPVEIERAGRRELSRFRFERGGVRRWLARFGRCGPVSRQTLEALAVFLASAAPAGLGRVERAGLFRLARAYADGEPHLLNMAMRELPESWRAQARAAWESLRGRCSARESRRLRREFGGGKGWN